MQENTQNTNDKIADADFTTTPGKSILTTFLLSFMSGVLGALITLFVYLKYFSYPPIRYYSFDLSQVVKTAEDKVMHQKPGKDLSEIKKDLDSYFAAMGNYVNYYAKNGIVFVGGATLGKSPYVKDITGGFNSYYESYKNARKRLQHQTQ